MARILCVAGARPNFMKVAPILDAVQDSAHLSPMLVHTGQHYDESMSKVFFDELDLPRPEVNLGVGSGGHGTQTGKVMIRFEALVQKVAPDLVLVVGDVNSTLACALVAVKLEIPVAHVEAGLRSGDRSMPEEINRLLTDAIADFLFTTSRGAGDNLAAEGVPAERVYFVGNVMVDTLLRCRDLASSSTILGELDLDSGSYALVTLHRPANVDQRVTLTGMVDALVEVSERLPVVFPAHPRTRERLDEFDLVRRLEESGVKLLEPLGYVDFLRLMSDARVVLTDSGGIQEETTVLGVPCLTLRDNTERPVTVEEGTNRLVGSDPSAVLPAVEEVLRDGADGRIPELWDGRAAERIVEVVDRAIEDGRIGDTG